MRESQKQFKRPPKRHQPRGLSILYEDRDILVVDKVSGLLTVSNEKVRCNTAYYLLRELYRKVPTARLPWGAYLFRSTTFTG